MSQHLGCYWSQTSHGPIHSSRVRLSSFSHCSHFKQQPELTPWRLLCGRQGPTLYTSSNSRNPPEDPSEVDYDPRRGDSGLEELSNLLNVTQLIRGSARV